MAELEVRDNTHEILRIQKAIKFVTARQSDGRQSYDSWRATSFSHLLHSTFEAVCKPDPYHKGTVMLSHATVSNLGFQTKAQAKAAFTRLQEMVEIRKAWDTGYVVYTRPIVSNAEQPEFKPIPKASFGRLQDAREFVKEYYVAPLLQKRHLEDRKWRSVYPYVERDLILPAIEGWVTKLLTPRPKKGTQSVVSDKEWTDFVAYMARTVRKKLED